MKNTGFLPTAMALPALAFGSGMSEVRKNVERGIQRSRIHPERNFDVIVLGVGSMGSATCYYLAKQGARVLGLDQFDIPNDLSSHTGQSRIIRRAYFEHPDYVPLLDRAYANWKELESLTRTDIYFRTGLLYAGKPGSALIAGVLESAEKYQVPVDRLSSGEQEMRFPQFDLPANYETVYEPDAGFVTPERAILLYAEQALMRGAIIRSNEKAGGWTRTADGIRVETASGTYFAKKLIISAGAWAPRLLNSLSGRLQVTRQMIAWVKPKEWEAFEFGNFPCWLVEDEVKKGAFYGFPILPMEKFGGPVGLKLAHHYPHDPADPDTISRTPTEADEALILYGLNKYLPGAYESTLEIKTCMYTNTPDEHFILDFVPGYGQDVIAATGFSGHGFKFASVVGEIMSELALEGKSSQPIGFLNAERFQ